MSAYLQLKGLKKVFVGKDRKEHIAMDDLSIDVKQGELLTLLGPSGCGKTTALRSIAGFEYPSEGSVLLGGVDITNVPPNKRGVTMVFQHYALFPHYSVFDNVAFGLVMKRYERSQIKGKVADMLVRVGLEGLGKRMPNELSGGQQQRVALARALIVEPKVLLFDEPLSNLDAGLRIQMRKEIRRIQREFKITTVYVTHDHEEAMALSDRIALMNNGRIVQIGRPADFYRAPASDFVRDFFGNAAILDGEFKDGALEISDVRIKVADAERSGGRKFSVVIKPDQLTVIEG